MTRISRRDGLKMGVATIAATGAAAVTGPGPAQAQANNPKMPFRIATTTIPIVGTSDVFPVRRVYCIGRNYAAHAREMGSDPTREPPFFFRNQPMPFSSSRPERLGIMPTPR